MEKLVDSIKTSNKFRASDASGCDGESTDPKLQEFLKGLTHSKIDMLLSYIYNAVENRIRLYVS